MREVGTQQRLAAHQRQHPASGVAQPVDRALGHVLGHAAHAVVEGPAVMAVEVALPLVEQVGDDRVEVARHHARANERERPCLASRGRYAWRCACALPFLGKKSSSARRHQLGMLREHRRRQLLLLAVRRRRQQPRLLRRLHQQIVQLHIKTIRRGSVASLPVPATSGMCSGCPFFSRASNAA